jgi:hypothetical protein
MTEEEELDILEPIVKEKTQKMAKPKVEVDEEVEENEPIQVKKKKVMTKAQLEALARGRATKKANSEVKMTAKSIQAQKDKEELEAKIVKKAISIKKKQIKKQVALDEVSDDETDIQVVRKMAAKIPVVQVPKCKYQWM